MPEFSPKRPRQTLASIAATSLWLALVMGLGFGVMTYYRNGFSDPNHSGTSAAWRPEHDLHDSIVTGVAGFVFWFIVLFIMFYRDSRKPR